MKDSDKIIENFKFLIDNQELTCEAKKLILDQLDELIEVIVDESFESGQNNILESQI
jgi:hypothetical protein